MARTVIVSPNYRKNRLDVFLPREDLSRIRLYWVNGLSKGHELPSYRFSWLKILIFEHNIFLVQRERV